MLFAMNGERSKAIFWLMYLSVEFPGNNVVSPAFKQKEWCFILPIDYFSNKIPTNKLCYSMKLVEASSYKLHFLLQQKIIREIGSMHHLNSRESVL